MEVRRLTQRKNNLSWNGAKAVRKENGHLEQVFNWVWKKYQVKKNIRSSVLNRLTLRSLKDGQELAMRYPVKAQFGELSEFGSSYNNGSRRDVNIINIRIEADNSMDPSVDHGSSRKPHTLNSQSMCIEIIKPMLTKETTPFKKELKII